MVDVTIINQLVFQLSKVNSDTGAKLEHPFCWAQCCESFLSGALGCKPNCLLLLYLRQVKVK